MADLVISKGGVTQRVNRADLPKFVEQGWLPVGRPAAVQPAVPLSLDDFNDRVRSVGDGRYVTPAVGNATYATHKQLTRNVDLLIAGTITRDSNGAATSAPVVWPDGSPGTYTATTLSTSFPGAVDAYTVTYGSPVTKTYTQPAVTRNANGAATNVPEIVVS